MQQIEQSIDRYLAVMDSADRAAPEVAEAKAERLSEKIEKLKAQLHASPDQQISLTDPDARSMATSGEVECKQEVKSMQPPTKRFEHEWPRFSGELGERFYRMWPYLMRRRIQSKGHRALAEGDVQACYARWLSSRQLIYSTNSLRSP